MFEPDQTALLIIISVAVYLFFGAYTIFTLLYLDRIRKKTSLNSNLRLLLGHIAVPMWFMLLMDSILTTIFLFNDYTYPFYTPAWYPLDMSLMVFLAHLMAQLAERAFATVLVTKYEEIGTRFPIIGFKIIIAQWIYGIICFFIMKTRALKYVTGFQFAFETVVTVTMYYLLPRISNRMYEEYKYPSTAMQPSRITLGLRYQTSENLKAANLTSKIITVQIFTSLITFGLHLYARKFTTQNSFEWLMIMKVMHGGLGISAVVQQSVVLYELRSANNSSKVVNVSQQQAAASQQRIYFQQLADQWNQD